MRKEKITCHFCFGFATVLSIDNDHWKCEKCNATYSRFRFFGDTRSTRVALQDFAQMSNKVMGYMIVFGTQGDVSRDDAEIVLHKDHESVNGFTKLGKDFMNLLWYSSSGTNAVFHKELIEDVGKQFAKNFSATDEEQILTQLTFGRLLWGQVNKNRLREVHEILNNIPPSNDNLLRYLIAEGQEQLIAKASHKLYKHFIRSKNQFVVKLAKAVCE